MRARRALRRRMADSLKELFGLDTFRPGQEAAVTALLRGRDVFCVFPTGAGKSLCYQLPAVIHGGLTVVVSPLIALMRDQVAHLDKLGIPAVCLDSLQDKEELDRKLSLIRAGCVRLAYVSPERLATQGFRQVCQACPPWLVVVDEAHCVDRWGEEFRPLYREVPTFIADLAQRPVHCVLTATADPAMRRAVSRETGLHHPKNIILPVTRPNLTYRVQPTIRREAALLRLLAAMPEGKAIVYCATRKATERIAVLARDNGVPARCYHAGLSREERAEVQEAFTAGILRAVAATTAFGMGVDVPDVRLVVHFDLPENLTDYAQQAGRAGRDGMPADCVLLLDPLQLFARRTRLRRMHNQKTSPRLTWYRHYRAAVAETNRLMDWCFSGRCLAQGLARAFGQHAARCGTCAACVRAKASGKWRRVAPALRLSAMSESGLYLWVLRWLRDGIAREKGVRPSDILPTSDMEKSAKHRRLLPESRLSSEDRRRIEDVLAHLRGE